MALVKCPDCGREVSSEAPACVGCGRPMKSAPPPVDREPDPERIFGIALLKVVSALRNIFVFLVLSVGLVAVFWKGSEWVQDHLYPWAFGARLVALFLLIPLGLVFVVFRSTRFLGGSLLIQASWITGANLWLISLTYLRAVSVFLTIMSLTVGVFLGAIPTAIVTAFVRRAGDAGWGLVALGAETIVIRVLGFWIVGRDIARREKATARIANDALGGSP